MVRVIMTASTIYTKKLYKIGSILVWLLLLHGIIEKK